MLVNGPFSRIKLNKDLCRGVNDTFIVSEKKPNKGIFFFSLSDTDKGNELFSLSITSKGTSKDHFLPVIPQDNL